MGVIQRGVPERLRIMCEVVFSGIESSAGGSGGGVVIRKFAESCV